MPEVTDYLILFAIVLGVNLMPAFGPPTWSVIALYGLNTNLPVEPLVLTAAIAAALGRFILAQGFRLLSGPPGKDEAEPHGRPEGARAKKKEHDPRPRPVRPFAPSLGTAL